MANKVSLQAVPQTDIWRKPPSIDDFNAKHELKKVPISIFKKARVTISANWERQYDQGGLLLTFDDEHTNEQPSHENKPRRWIKTGIEFVDGAPYISTVTCDRWADWSVLPTGNNGKDTHATIEVQRDKSSLWIYLITTDKEGGEEKKMFIRKVTWAFVNDHGKMGVGVYCCRPTKNGDDDVAELDVQFDDYNLETEFV